VNTVFYDEVRIPRTNVVGAIGDGWATALATLAFERGTGFIGDQLELYERVQRAIELLFGNVFITPSIDEQGMYLARAAALRSASLARQVGAAICRPDGTALKPSAISGGNTPNCKWSFALPIRITPGKTSSNISDNPTACSFSKNPLIM
jgi:hypothetical protein